MNFHNQSFKRGRENSLCEENRVWLVDVHFISCVPNIAQVLKEELEIAPSAKAFGKSGIAVRIGSGEPPFVGLRADMDVGVNGIYAFEFFMVE